MIKTFYIVLLGAITADIISASALKCKFEKNAVYSYTCIIDKTENVSSGDLLDTEDHLVNKTNDHVKMISFSRSTVKELPTKMFTTFKNVEILDMMDVKLMSWSRDYVKNAKKLKKIWLDKNEISELAENSFMGASGTLKVLVMNGNVLKNINEKALASLVHLTNLDLEDNKLEILKKNVLAPLTDIKEINLKGNQIKTIESRAFEKNIGLELLNLSDNKIEKLANDIFKNLDKLAMIHLQRNEIASVSDKLFEDCKNLIEIRLDGNKIKTWPAAMTKNMNRLKMLDLLNNEIKEFNGEFLSKDTEYLYIDDNVETSNLPDKIEVFKGEKMDARNNVWTNTNETSEAPKPLSADR